MSHLAELAKLPKWEVTFQVAGKSKPDTKTVRAPTPKKAGEYIQYAVQQRTNGRITIIKVVPA